MNFTCILNLCKIILILKNSNMIFPISQLIALSFDNFPLIPQTGWVWLQKSKCKSKN